MSRTAALFEFMPYGAPELQSVARPYMIRALLVSMALTTLLFASLGLLQNLFGSMAGTTAPRAITMLRPPAPPSLLPVPPKLAVAPALPQHVVAGVPVPTADERVAVETTIANADELRAATPGTGTSDVPLVIETPAEAETLPRWNEFVPVDEMPVAVQRVEPEYPSIAREADVSGTVLTLVLVGRDGKVLDVKVDEHRSIPMLNDAAMEAARRWVFTPAYSNHKPVAVWVAVPFSFRLH